MSQRSVSVNMLPYEMVEKLQRQHNRQFLDKSEETTFSVSLEKQCQATNMRCLKRGSIHD